MFVLNHKFGIGSEFPWLISLLFTVGSQARFSIPMLILNHKFGIGSENVSIVNKTEYRRKRNPTGKPR